MEYGGLSQNSQRPSTSFYPNVDENSPRPYPSTWIFILKLCFYLRLGFPRGICLSDFPTKTLYEAPLYVIRAPCPSHFIFILTAPLWMYFFYLISYHTRMWEMENT